MSQQVVNRLLPAAGSASPTGGVGPAMPTDADARQSDQAGFASSAFAPVYSSAGRSDLAPAADPAVDLAGDLERLSRLHAIGELSDEEFGRAKAHVLTRAEPVR
jgi:hypothetical protein